VHKQELKKYLKMILYHLIISMFLKIQDKVIHLFKKKSKWQGRVGGSVG